MEFKKVELAPIGGTADRMMIVSNLLTRIAKGRRAILQISIDHLKHQQPLNTVFVEIVGLGIFQSTDPYLDDALKEVLIKAADVDAKKGAENENKNAHDEKDVADGRRDNCPMEPEDDEG